MSSVTEIIPQQIATDLENRLPVAAAQCEPTFWGRLFTLQSHWKVDVRGADLTLKTNGTAIACDPLNVSLTPGLFWNRLTLKTLDGKKTSPQRAF